VGRPKIGGLDNPPHDEKTSNGCMLNVSQPPLLTLEQLACENW
jgi:hypothetical protein